MVKFFTRFFVVVLIFLSFSDISYAFFGSSFGGKIILKKAREIQTLEGVGYTCQVNGSTIEIDSVKGPTSYFIPYTSKVPSGSTPSYSKKILGVHKGEAEISCTNDDGDTQLVTLPKITRIFNISIR